MDTPPDAARFTFDGFELDVAAGELRQRGVRTRVNGQPLQILIALVEHAGHIVSRDELRARLWPDDTFVEFDHSLNTAVKRLREALGDEASTPRFIETVPRRGYRFIAPVERVGTAAELGEPSSAASRESPVVIDVRRTNRWLPLVGVMTVAVMAVIAIGLLSRGRASRATDAERTGRIRLAVLPFANLTGDPERAYVSEGLSEEITAQLGRLAPGRLVVIGRSSTTWPEGRRPALPELAEALRVDYVIEGSVRRIDEAWRVAVRLVETRDLGTVWGELYDAPLERASAIERQIPQQVVRQLALTALPDDPAALARATTASTAAFDAYLRARSQLARGPEEGFRESARWFRRAVDDDPAYAVAWAGLSEAHLRLRDYALDEPGRALGPARDAALKALALDEGLAEAHCALGDVLGSTGDLSSAEREFRRALSLNPSHAASYDRYAWHLVRVGRRGEARTLIARARGLAPRSAEIATTAAYLDLESGRLEEAATLARSALDYEPDYPFARYVLGRIAMRRGAPATAIDEFAKARVASRDAPKYLAALVSAYLAAGRIDEATRVAGDLRAIATTRYVPPGMIERVHDDISRFTSRTARASTPPDPSRERR